MASRLCAPAAATAACTCLSAGSWTPPPFEGPSSLFQSDLNATAQQVLALGQRGCGGATSGTDPSHRLRPPPKNLPPLSRRLLFSEREKAPYARYQAASTRRREKVLCKKHSVTAQERKKRLAKESELFPLKSLGGCVYLAGRSNVLSVGAGRGTGSMLGIDREKKKQTASVCGVGSRPAETLAGVWRSSQRTSLFLQQRSPFRLWPRTSRRCTGPCRPPTRKSCLVFDARHHFLFVNPNFGRDWRTSRPPAHVTTGARHHHSRSR